MEEKTSKKLIDSLFVKVCKKLRNHDKELNENFIKLNTNFDRFKFIWHMTFVHHDLDTLFSSKSNYSPKDQAKASQYRKEGNEEFKIKRFYDALLKYNLSIKFAPFSTNSAESDAENDLALAYANRSAVFFHLNEFVLCLNDIESAIKFGYPAKFKSKLIERKLNCLFKLENFAQFAEVLNCEKKSLEPALVKTYEAKLSNKLNLHDKIDTTENSDYFIKKFGNISFELDSVNSQIPEAASSIQIDYNLEKGYHLKAARDIKAGELLIYEKPYASVLLGDYFETNCYECMARINVLKMNVSFCRQCSQVSYCSRKCEKSSWKSHKFECKYLKLLAFDSGLSHMEWLALRIILTAGKDYLLSVKPILEDYEKKFELLPRDLSSLLFLDEEANKTYRSDSYLTIFNLITNSRVRKLNDLFRRSFVSLFMVKLLEKTGYFETDSAEGFKENSWFIGGLILRHLQSISCNAHEISELKLSDSRKNAMASSQAHGIGAGIYAILSIFNHSCDPHVTRNFRGSKCQVRAIQSVKKGEEIFDNYGVVYAVNELKERQEKLKEQYFFECQCKACKKDWPSYDKIPSNIDSLKIKCAECLKSKNNDLECSACLAEIDNLKLNQLNAQLSLKSLLNINSQMDLNDPGLAYCLENFFDFFCKYLQLLFHHKVARPFQDYNSYEEALKQLLNLVNIK